MSSSSVVSTSDSSSSNEGTSAHTQAEVSHSPRGPPRQLCQCSKCVGQISQKSYVCAQHIQRFRRHRGLTPGASSSHVVSGSFYHCHFPSLIHVIFHEILFETIFTSMVCCGFLNVIGFPYDTTTLCSITRGFSCHRKCTFTGICCRDWYLS